MGTTDQDRDLLTSYLADRDVPCPRCRYSLRNVRGERCPECGEKLQLQVGAVYPKPAALLAGLIGLAAAAGFNAILLASSTYSFFRYADVVGSDPFRVLGTLSGVGTVIDGAALVLWLVFWQRLWRLSAKWRWTLVGCCWILALAGLVGFIFFTAL